MGKWMYSSTHS